MILMEFLEEPMFFPKLLKLAYEVGLMNVIGYCQHCVYIVLDCRSILPSMPNYDELL